MAVGNQKEAHTRHSLRVVRKAAGFSEAAHLQGRYSLPKWHLVPGCSVGHGRYAQQAPGVQAVVPHLAVECCLGCDFGVVARKLRRRIGVK